MILHPVNTSIPEESTINIKEAGKTKLHAIKLYIPTHECLVFTLNVPGNKAFNRKSNYLRDGYPNIHQGCDFVVTCIYKNKLHFILIELKSDSPGGGSTQLWNSKPFVKYLDNLLDCHFPEYFKTLAREYRCLLFSTAKAHQAKTIIKFKVASFRDDRGFSYFIGGAPREFRLTSILKT